MGVKFRAYIPMLLILTLLLAVACGGDSLDVDASSELADKGNGESASVSGGGSAGAGVLGTG